MNARIVSEKERQSFFRDFSRIHNGALVTISFVAPGTASRDEIVDQPLRGISDDGNEVFVNAGDGGARPHLERRVRNVDAVLLQQTDEGADAAVDIASVDGSRTVVRFRSPALPELLDPGVE